MRADALNEHKDVAVRVSKSRFKSTSPTRTPWRTDNSSTLRLYALAIGNYVVCRKDHLR